ncbi:vesicle-associated membrane protein 5-like [Corythoichthys intestinalis]|uniref:vesicle-associated membrane protein 5-like n=1 Tax=Corythoichthys intestinalis TaxID=161448 RepID=UPI0025A61A85|nr:vesicle-associated membrane protein 5-like [Corythoichthys intestinalis]
MHNGKSQLQQAQEDAEEVGAIMLDNMNKAQERHWKLDDLDERAEALLQKSKVFEKTTRQVKESRMKKAKCKKLIIIIIVVVVVLVIISLVAIICSFVIKK